MSNPAKNPGKSHEQLADNAQPNILRRLTIVGRGECGKTSITRRFFKNEFCENISATPIENQDYEFSIENKQFLLKIWDTSGQDDFLRFRGLTLQMSDYVMLCYSIIDPLSFYEVENTLVPMVKQKAKENTKIMLVATKIDKRTDDTITTEEGTVLARKIGAFKFIECSALANIGIDDIFSVLRKDMSELADSKRPGFFSKLFFCCN